ncbi:hypothetical protein [Methylobacterium sp. Leaf93]|uniref:hypothetical protein n=1 Tax=Methylobacterium sp. Leaf93 TaxID=1736249 RepID=UPI0006FD41E9|nr:hypothetical protein [Methylobacterium sp. Leaf93]KQP02679.1 hypothetical protein ASF26_14720 [Methylobacterium sp. Leaf93]
MILDRIREGFCRALCPHLGGHHNTPGEDRLERAEKLHILSAQDAANESRKTGLRVGDMRKVANSAVDRLRHDRIDGEEVEQ